MAYADQQMSGNRVIALIVVALIHIVLVYALITGLAYEAVKKIAQRVTTIDIEEQEEPEEPPPPPPERKDVPPPPVAPPPPIRINTAPPPIVTVATPPPPPVIVVPQAPPPPPPPKFPPKKASPKNNPGRWATPDDYPSRALREDREGVARFRVSISVKGRVQSCDITRSSGHADLDAATCKYVSRRARFRPATDGDGNKTTGSYTNSVRWVIPD